MKREGGNMWTLAPGEFILGDKEQQIGPDAQPITIRVQAFGNDFNGLRIQAKNNSFKYLVLKIFNYGKSKMWKKL